ncbi:hypothetical protein GALMADRAFT_215163 [Galerina marginata CBS 339.88]|uniref:RNase H type-1 domain-containing protein n=1 Tax=Galerina marginata (strain CBS 339.88) TaxID=685588 RepID=A0A067SRX1_GALM3|nr:hypothetical protein GALMADRAFT_215163 [Galerina marginata CBS 339.88]
MLANTVKGLSQILLRRLYVACVVPKILALYLICAAFKTTPTEAVEIEAFIPPLDLQIQQQTKRRETFRATPPSPQVPQQLSNKQKKDDSTPRNRKTHLAQTRKTRHTEQVEELARSDKNLVIYSDGSLMKSGFHRAGAGVVMHHKGLEVKARMGMGHWEGKQRCTMAIG